MQIDINLVGSIYCCQAAAKIMLRQRQGSTQSEILCKTFFIFVTYRLFKKLSIFFLSQGVIINVGSVVGHMGNTGQAIYSASKSGSKFVLCVCVCVCVCVFKKKGVIFSLFRFHLPSFFASLINCSQD